MPKQDQVENELMSRICEHFNEKELKSSEVPEWGVTLFADPINGLIHDKIESITAKYSTAEAMARILQSIAKRSDGEKAFTIADIPKLVRKADVVVMTRIVNDLTSDISVKIEEKID